MLILPIIIIVAIVFTVIYVFDQDDVTINHYEATVTLDEAGNMHVEESFDMTYHRAMTVRFRDIDYQKFPDDYNFSYSSENQASFDEDSVAIRFFKDGEDRTDLIRTGFSFVENDADERGQTIRCEPVRNQCESLFFNARDAGGLEGDVRIEYDFIINGAVSTYSDISELNWVLFEYMEGPITSGTITINMPEKAGYSADDLRVWGHGIQDGNIEIVSENQIVLTINDVDAGEFLEFRVLMPTDYFPNIPNENIFIDDGINASLIADFQAREAARFNTLITVAQSLFVVSILAAIATILIAFRAQKKYFTPHDTVFNADYLRELPDHPETPAEMSYLYHYKHISDDALTATLLDLVRRKVITIDYEGQDTTSKKADFTLHLIEDHGVTLKAHEVELVDWMFNTIGDGSKVTTQAIKTYPKASYAAATNFETRFKSFKSKARREGASDEFFDTELPSLQRRVAPWALVPLAIAGIAFLISFLFYVDTMLTIVIGVVTAVSFLAYVFTRIKYSKEGKELYKQWNAFGNFLKEFGNFEDYSMPGVIVWEHYLVYATVLGLADKVIKQLEVKMPLTSSNTSGATFLAVGYGLGGRRGYSAGMNNLSNTIREGRRGAKARISQERASKSGGGGGFGGGSSRGGGGGGGRSR